MRLEESINMNLKTKTPIINTDHMGDRGKVIESAV